MATILSKKLELIDGGKETDVNIKHENYAKLKLYEALSDYGSWYIQSYRFIESGLYIKIQKDNEVTQYLLSWDEKTIRLSNPPCCRLKDLIRVAMGL